MSNFYYGLIVGRFQTFHNGHRVMIDTALRLCDHLVIFIGSSQESRTLKNPFNYELRKQMIELTFSDEYIEKNIPGYLSPKYEMIKEKLLREKK